jgi:hypothetical protein
MTGKDEDTDESTDEDTAVRALHDLVSEGQWQPIYSGPVMQTYIRPWPDNSADTIMFRDPRTAHGERVNPNGEPVWQLNGTVTTVVAALRALPKPDAPDAPRTILPRHDSTDRDM